MAKLQPLAVLGTYLVMSLRGIAMWPVSQKKWRGLMDLPK